MNKEFTAHPTNPVEGCADANPKFLACLRNLCNALEYRGFFLGQQASTGTCGLLLA